MFRKLLDLVKLAITLVLLFVVLTVQKLSAVRFFVSLVQLRRIKKFVGEAYILTKDEGGRHTPFFNNYRPQFYFRTTDVTGVVTLDAGTEMVMPGDNVTINVELIVPIAMEESFALLSAKVVVLSVPASLVKLLSN